MELDTERHGGTIDFVHNDTAHDVVATHHWCQVEQARVLVDDRVAHTLHVIRHQGLEVKLLRNKACVVMPLHSHEAIRIVRHEGVLILLPFQVATVLHRHRDH